MENERKKNSGEAFNTRRYGATPFDDAFKTEIVRLKEFIVPLINEIYGTDYALDIVDVSALSNDHYLMSEFDEDDDSIQKRLTDSCLRSGDKLYHIECQSTEDGNILIRLVEYNIQIGIENAHTDEEPDRLIIDLPRTSLLMLRSGGVNKPKKSTKAIVYRHEEQELMLNVPVLHVQSYTQEEIYDKKLYFLIPFYAIRYEKILDKIAKAPLETEDEYDKIISELERWFERLRKAYEGEEITEDEGRKLAELSRMILNHMTQRLEHRMAERMVKTVGGKVLELQEDRWLRQGMEMERINTERERKAKDEAIAELEKYRALYGSLPPEAKR